MLGYREPMPLSGILVPRNRLSQSAHQRVGCWGEEGAPWASQGSASASVLTLASHGSAQPHGPLPVSSGLFSSSQLRRVTTSGDKKGQDQLPRQQSSGGLSSIRVAGVSSLDSELNSTTSVFRVKILAFLLQELIKPSLWSSLKIKLLKQRCCGISYELNVNKSGLAGVAQ